MAETGVLGISDSQLGQILLGSSSASTVTNSNFTTDTVLRGAVSASITADAAFIPAPFGRSFSVDAVVSAYTRNRHNRWTEHSGTDKASDHILAQAFGPYLAGENLATILLELGARITAREGHYQHHLQRLVADAIFSKARASSFAADAAILKPA